MSDPLYRQPVGLMAAQSSDKTMVVVTYALFLLGFFTGGLTTLIGLVMAYMLRREASELALSHYVFLARTFWIGLMWSLIAGAAAMIGLFLVFTIVGLPLAFVLFIFAKIAIVLALIWYGARCVLGLIAALDDRSYGAPRSWLI